MPDESRPKDPAALWMGQPEEKLPVNMEYFVNRRTKELDSTSRSEILMSIVATLFFVVVIGWRFMSDQARFPQLGFAAAAVWVLISLYWFRNRIWRKDAGDVLASTGLDHYRHELERRRDHLRNAWLWHGPLFLACVTLAATTIGKTFVFLGPERLRSVLPLVILLAAWTAFGIWRRRRQANAIQREIDLL